MSLGKRFVQYVSSLQGNRDEKWVGPSWLDIPERFYPEDYEYKNRPGDVFYHREKAKSLDKALKEMSNNARLMKRERVCLRKQKESK